MDGKVVHFEIPADDLNRARAFYGDVFGWRIQEIPAMDYTMVQTVDADERGMPREPGAINGGMFARSEPFEGPVITIGVDDLDDALARVEKAGGAILRGRTAVGDMGFSGYFRDPDGNIVGLWQSA